MQVPLVKAIRDGLGGWTFTGPEGSEVSDTPAMETTLGAVSVVWPHVSGLIRVAPGQTAVWVWSRHGWATIGACDCGECVDPTAQDISRAAWPEALRPQQRARVDRAALEGHVSLGLMQQDESGFLLVGAYPGERPPISFVEVPLVNIIRRWPHTIRALTELAPGRVMHWQPQDLGWNCYELAMA
ncbi:hypothetical protein D5S17_31290 [Pseudonocardiaceae bacterium YIM PH 21723]|nr:hypothetical protein D5S17_31290 [Pseudonocardiaceae bacterium YIM PH 21723]